jgi:hypothetical protein
MSIFFERMGTAFFCAVKVRARLSATRRQGGVDDRADLGAANEESAGWCLSFCGGGRGPMR